MRDASADLFNSWLGNGRSPHRDGSYRGFVEHGHHALFRLEAFMEAGGYDPAFLANEDAELDMRLRANGRRIFLENRATIGYYPRTTLRSVFSQFFRNGLYRVRTSRKHGAPLQLRQLAPTFVAATFLLSVTFGALVHPILYVPAGLYLVAVAIAACAVATRKSVSRIGLVFATAVTSHVAFGLGALASLVRSLAPTQQGGAESAPARA